MRYVFTGLRRETAEPVKGHVTAPTEDVAYDVLGDNGIVAESLKPEPVESEAAVKTAHVASELEHALDDAGQPVDFDYLTRRYRGKKVWVLDRDKIRGRVMKIVDDAIAEHLRDDQDGQEARRYIARLLDNMFQNGHNLGSERSAQTVALEARVNELGSVVARIEKSMVPVSAGTRRGPQRDATRPRAVDRTRNEVLMELFQSNLALMRGLAGPVALPTNGRQAVG